MLPYLQERFGNSSSLHPYGQEARRGVDRARGQVADLLGCSPDEIVFTSGGTESNNLAILGTIGDAGGPGHKVTRLGVDRMGVVDLGEARDALNDPPFLLTIMHANNETGTMRPVKELARPVDDGGRRHHSRRWTCCSMAGPPV